MSDYPGYTLLETREVHEINATAHVYRHDRTGARVLSLITQDSNKVFGINFRTPPSDSTGVAHILEHSVLCGSRKYPVKEPFVELLKGSLHTFLNAMTYPDKTCYPVASENLQDFYNLVDVYLDAVFFPRITEEIFQQEGWHYEVDPTGPRLFYKGVVYNEMKGVYSSPDDLLGEYSQRVLFDSNTYGVDSGGDPREIPKLSYAQFRSFHETFYHPSNAYIYFYGNDDPARRFELLDEYLNRFEAAPVQSDIVPQPAYPEPRSFTYTYDPGALDPEQAKAMQSINWLLPSVTDLDLNMALGILAYTLVGTPASPLRKALIDSGLGEDLAGNGFANYIRQMYFSTGLRGVDPARTAEVETLIFDTLRRIAEEGIDPDLIEAAVNTTEFRLRECNTGGYPRGLAYMLASLCAWLYDADPIDPLAFEAPLARLKERLASQPRFLESLLQEHLLDNPHRASVFLVPQQGRAEALEQEERARLENVRAGLTDVELHAIAQQAEALKRMQETPDPPEALAAIPSLTRGDLSPNIRTVPTAFEQLADTTVLVHDLFTSGIVYLDVGFDLATLPDRLLPLAPLYARCLTEMGTQTEDFVRLSNRIGRCTGGVGASPLLTTSRDERRPVSWLMLRGKATLNKADDLLAIMRDVLTTTRFDLAQRFRQLLLEEKAEYESHLVPSGHSYVDTRLRAGLSQTGWLAEQTKGVTNLFFVRDLARRMQQDWAAIEADLLDIQRHLVTRARAIVNVTLDAEDWKVFAPKLKGFLEQLPAESRPDAPRTFSFESKPEGLSAPTQVNYVGKGVNVFDLGYRPHGSSAVVLHHLRSAWLWDRVRVQGGAYGAFCSLDHRAGALTFGSYRDPNFRETLTVYDRSGDYLRTTAFSEAEVTKSVVGAIGAMDPYRLPDAKGYSELVRHLARETVESRQQFRDEVLSTTASDFRAFADVLDLVREHGHVVAMGAAETLSKAADGDTVLSILPVL